jgi:TolB-like protein/DNA-binding SARP family transcriptional activator
MVPLKLNILGRFEARLPSGEIVSLPTRKTETLLTYIALVPGPHSRDHLVNLLWGDRSEQQARNSLRQALSALKKLFDEFGLQPLQIERTTVSLANQSIEIDAVMLEDLINEQTPQAAAQANRLYRGEFLEGVVVRDPNGEEWLAAERNHFRELAAHALETELVFQHESGEFGKAGEFAERLVSINPLNESAWQKLMRVYADRGDRNHALMAYKRCSEVLNKELGVEPSQETTRLQAAILDGSGEVSRKIADSDTEISSETSTAGMQKPSGLGGKPSIAILPFLNMSDDPGQEYFSDGITEDIITGLCRFRELIVIARGSSFAFKGKAVDVTEAAERLGARYVLEGSVRKAGERVRITAQLSDTTTGNHLWAESYDRVLDDVFAVQDDVAHKIISTLAIRLEEEGRERAMRKSVTNLSAYDCYLRGKHYFPDWQGSKENILQARGMFEKALAIDPDYALAYSGLAETYLAECWTSWTPNHDAAADRTFECARKAVELDNRDSHAHIMLACAYFFVMGNFELAEIEIQKALDLNPNDYWNYCLKTQFSMCSGDFEESIYCGNEAIQRNPFLPDSCLHGMGFSEYFAERYENAIKTFGRLSEPGLDVHACIAACFAQLGRVENATDAVAKFHDQAKAELNNQSWDSEGWQEYWTSLFTFKNPEQLTQLIDGLRKAGLLV